jgi:hypothetical protein
MGMKPADWIWGVAGGPVKEWKNGAEDRSRTDDLLIMNQHTWYFLLAQNKADIH